MLSRKGYFVLGVLSINMIIELKYISLNFDLWTRLNVLNSKSNNDHLVEYIDHDYKNNLDANELTIWFN